MGAVAARIRLHLDEQVDAAVALALRRRGVDVTTTPDVGLRSQSDQAQLAFARSADRVIVTGDVDFLRLHHRGLPHAGIAYYKTRDTTLRRLVRALVSLCESSTPQEIRGQVRYL